MTLRDGVPPDTDPTHEVVDSGGTPIELETAASALEESDAIRSRMAWAGRTTVPGIVLRRIRDGILTLALVVAVVFILTNIVGDPALVYAPVDASDAEIARIETAFGLDRPFPERFVEYFADVARGDFGDSNWQKRPALDAVLEALPATIQLTLAGIIGAALFGVIGGILAGSRPNSWLDRIANFFSVSALSVPNFWLGLLLIFVFAVKFPWFPTSGKFGWDSIVLPAVTLATVHGGRIFQLVRSATVEEVSKPYVRVAKSKGLSNGHVLRRHVLRNTGLTTATITGWEYVRMWGGAAFAIEYVFAWPGIGTLMINAADRQDFFVLQAAVIIAGAFVIISNLIIDLTYRAIDRRIGAG
jgi:peptide/nickel transport system permease protein